MVNARIDLSELNRELGAFKQEFETWSQKTITEAEDDRDMHLKRLKDCEASIRSLYQQQIDLEKKSLEIQQRLTDEQIQIKELEEELSKVQAEQNELPGLLAEVRSELETETSAAEARSRSVAAREASAQKTLRGVQTALEMYKQRLGLEFENSEGNTMEITFTKLDSTDPNRKFVLKICVEDDTYDAVDCNPPLKNISELVDELNYSDDFSRFVRKLRKSFQLLT